MRRSTSPAGGAATAHGSERRIERAQDLLRPLYVALLTTYQDGTYQRLSTLWFGE